jgi:hypothetical protein
MINHERKATSHILNDHSPNYVTTSQPKRDDWLDLISSDS